MAIGEAGVDLHTAGIGVCCANTVCVLCALRTSRFSKGIQTLSRAELAPLIADHTLVSTDDIEILLGMAFVYWDTQDIFAAQRKDNAKQN